MLETVAAIVAILGAGFGLYKGAVEWKRKRIPREEKDERLKFLLLKLEKLESERHRFQKIRNGEHLKPLVGGGERISLTTLPFEIIRERTEAILDSDQRRYGRLGNRIISIVNSRGSKDLVAVVDELEPPLDKFVAKVKKEVRKLRL